MTDREKLIELLETVPAHQRLYPDLYVDYLIENGVTIQKRGKWVHKNKEMYCSVCNEEALMDEIYYESPHCPDCGAIMGEE